MRRLIHVAAATALALTATSCVNIRSSFGTPIAEDRVPDIVDGETTRSEVREWFGPPSTFFRPTLLDLITADDESDVAGGPGQVTEDVYTWIFVDSTTRFLFFPIFFLTADFGSRSSTLSVFFDENGVVKYHAFRVDES